MTEQPLFPVPDPTPPLAADGSGPDLSPAAVAQARMDNLLGPLLHGRYKHASCPPEWTEDGPSFLATLSQKDPAMGLRGWALYVVRAGAAHNWPATVISRPATRPPAIDVRLTALRNLGFEPEHPDDEWTWGEFPAFDGKTILLKARLIVREIEPAAPAAVLEHREGATA